MWGAPSSPDWRHSAMTWPQWSGLETKDGYVGYYNDIIGAPIAA
jgi:hypothetical protein